MRTTVANVSEDLNSLTSRHSRPNTEDALGKVKLQLVKMKKTITSVPFQSIFPDP